MSRPWKRNFLDQSRGAACAVDLMKDARANFDASDSKEEWWGGFMAIVTGYMAASISRENSTIVLAALFAEVNRK